MSGIIQLLYRRGLPKGGRIKIIRHQDKRCDLHKLKLSDFEAGYQAYQSRPVFNCDHIVSCIGLPKSKARFVGVYQVNGQRPAEDVPPPRDFPYLKLFFPGGTHPPGIWYDLVKLTGFEDLENRVVIDWGRSAIQWAQWATLDKDKEILQMPAELSHRSPVYLAEEILDGSTYSEGSVSRILVNRYERDTKARKACIAHYGAKCDLCGFVFADFYGDIASDFIHVHHLRAISEVGANYKVNPIKDLRPVCPNCHAILHRRDPAYSLDELRRWIKSNGKWPDKPSANPRDGLRPIPV